MCTLWLQMTWIHVGSPFVWYIFASSLRTNGRSGNMSSTFICQCILILFQLKKKKLTVGQPVSLTPRCGTRLWSCSAQDSGKWLLASRPGSRCNCIDTSKSESNWVMMFTTCRCFHPVTEKNAAYLNSDEFVMFWAWTRTMYVMFWHRPGCICLLLIHLSLVSTQLWWMGSTQPCSTASFLSLSI